MTEVDGYRGTWEVLVVRCPHCRHQQVSVHPSCCTRLECGRCHRWIRLYR